MKSWIIVSKLNNYVVRFMAILVWFSSISVFHLLNCVKFIVIYNEMNGMKSLVIF